MNHLISAMRTFLKVVDVHGFARAAEQLHLSPARVTRLVSDLESHLGVRLLQRSTRRVVLTDVGSRYAAGCRALLSDLERIESSAMADSSRISGHLHVAVLGSLMSPELSALFADFQERHAGVSLNITLTESEVDLLGGGFDVGIVADRMINSTTLVSRTLAHSPLVAVASLAYLMSAPQPQRPADLAEHRIITHVARGKTFLWIDGGGENHSVQLDACFSINSSLLQRQLALAGAGIALLPEFLVANDMRIGTLTQVLSDFHIENDDVTIKLVYQGRELLPGKVRAFIDFAVSHFDLSLGRSAQPHAIHVHGAPSHNQKILQACGLISHSHGDAFGGVKDQHLPSQAANSAVRPGPHRREQSSKAVCVGGTV
ncbi:LysR family transcriptional regulator [Paraburkholderia sacchari]|uniref:LysR family transcriptional regulator n=1 Tax=Paraburkholderia sacchari TaxID=159450 RepID=UPI00246819A9|nr:LysR family transcriptional regulator [Paraburkholderia sacchari]